MCNKVPEFANFSFEDAREMIGLVTSRVFSLRINEKKIVALVPFGDMLNH
jgi:hypothetical protein